MVYKIIIIVGSLLVLLSILDITFLPLQKTTEKFDSYYLKRRRGPDLLLLRTIEGNSYVIPEKMDGLYIDSNKVIAKKTYFFRWKKEINYSVNGAEYNIDTGIILDAYLLHSMVIFWIASVLSFLFLSKLTSPKCKYIYERFLIIALVLVCFLITSFFLSY